MSNQHLLELATRQIAEELHSQLLGKFRNEKHTHPLKTTFAVLI